MIKKQFVVKVNQSATGKGSVHGQSAGSDPAENVLILGDDGNFYMVTADVWKQQPIISSQDPMFGTLATLAKNGTYLASLPTDSASGGIGSACTLVSVQSVLKNNS